MKRRGIRSFLLFPLVLIVTCGFWSTANPAWGWSDERELLVVADIENPADVAALRDVPGLIIEETYDGWAQVRLTESAYEQFKD
ncbi:MAG: hypothetical protein M5R36_13750 [Deltaproteobacteria bacterium]|nr:hypothetical protein [Deltaproteobacteria bacterium]